MSTEVIMPQMGESIAEGTITKWYKKVGDKVERDEPLFEISTDKVDTEIPSPSSGVLSEIKVDEGETVPINTVVAIRGGEGETVVAPQPAGPAPTVPGEICLFGYVRSFRRDTGAERYQEPPSKVRGSFLSSRASDGT